MRAKAEQRLGTDLDRGAGRRGIIDQVAASSRAHELCRRQPVEAALGVVAEEMLKRGGEGGRGNVSEAALAGKQRRDPFLGAVEQHVVGKRRNRGIEAMREGRAGA